MKLKMISELPCENCMIIEILIRGGGIFLRFSFEHPCMHLEEKKLHLFNKIW